MKRALCEGLKYKSNVDLNLGLISYVAVSEFEESQLQLLVLLGAVYNKGSLNIHCFLVYKRKEGH